MFKLILFLIITLHILFSQNKWELVAGSDTLNGQRIELIKSLDSNNCFLLLGGQSTGNKIYKTTNQGETWDEIASLVIDNGRRSEGVSFVNENDFYLTASPKFLAISKNGGIDFKVIEIESPYSFLYKMIMKGNNGIIVSFPYSVFTDDDWSSNYHIELGFISDFDFIDSNKVLILTNTEDDKINHIYMELYLYNFETQEIIHISEIGGYIFPWKMELVGNNIFIVGQAMNSLSGGSSNNVIYKSSDLGKSWRRVHDIYFDINLIPYLEDITESKVLGILDVSFKNDSVGIAVGRSGMIMHTYDAGETWFYEYEENIPEEIRNKSATMKCEFIGETPIISGHTKYLYRLKEDNLKPKPEDTITVDGYILEKGEPKEGIAICLDNRFAMTDSNGYFRFIKVRDGDYTLTPINNENAFYLPYDFEPKNISTKFNKDTTINFELIDKREYFSFSGRVVKNGDGLEGIAVEIQLDDSKIVPVLDTTYTDENGIYMFENKENRRYWIRPLSDKYTFSPKEILITIDRDRVWNDPFRVEFNSVTQNPNFQIRDNVLISEEVAGMNYRIISLSGRVVKSANLPKELNLNAHPTGTYILQITKSEQVIFTHKFQVVR